MFGVLGNTVFLQFLLPVQHSLAEFFEVYVLFLGLREHLVFFFLDVMPHALGKNGELRVAMVSAAPLEVEFCDQNPGDVVLFVGLIHNVRSHMLSNRRVKDFLFDPACILSSVMALSMILSFSDEDSAFSNL